METITKETGNNTIEKVSTPCSDSDAIDGDIVVERGLSKPTSDTDKLEYKQILK